MPVRTNLAVVASNTSVSAEIFVAGLPSNCSTTAAALKKKRGTVCKDLEIAR